MLRNYLIVALRTLKRRPSYTTINVGGLAVGLAACLLIGLWVGHQLSYDEHFPDAERIYRLASDEATPEGERNYAMSPPAWGPALARQYPEVKKMTRFSVQDHQVSYGGSGVAKGEGENRDDGTHLSGTRAEAEVLHTDSSFFDVFEIDLLQGEAESALNSPYNLVLSKSFAEKHFPSHNPVGKLFKIDNRIRGFEVVGVMEDVPSSSHFSADIVMPLSDFQREEVLSTWTELRTFYTYLKLGDEKAAGSLQAKILNLLQRRLGPEEEKRYAPVLQPLTSIHLHSDREHEIQPGVDVRYVQLLALVAGLVLLIACANYVNLATARSAERAKEVGMRRALGARRTQVAGQFLGEALIVVGAATAIALLLVPVGRPLLKKLSGADLAGLSLLGSPLAALFVLGVTVGVALLASAYPAFYLSGFAPASVLRGGSGAVASQQVGRLRRGLVVFQFATAVALLVGTAVVWQQLRFLQSKELGFDKERVATLPADTRALLERRETIKAEMKRRPGIESVATASALPGGAFSSSRFRRAGQTAPVEAALMQAGPNLSEVLRLEMAAGRWFSKRRATDSTAFVINETAAHRLGFASARKAVGKRLEKPSNSNDGQAGASGQILGVVKDFNFRSLRREVGPLVIQLPSIMWDLEHFVVRAKSDALPAALSGIEKTWKEFAHYPEYYSLSFLGEDWAALYRAEQRMRRFFTVFAGLTVLLACLGLFGLAAFAAERRRKEIAVRKSLGATAGQVVTLLSKDFLKLVGVGFVLAVPVAWYAMRQWLEGFAYHVELGPGVFLAAGAAALAVAAVAVSTQAWRAARTNPAQALRDE